MLPAWGWSAFGGYRSSSDMIKNAVSLFIIAVIIALLFLPSYAKMQELKQKNEEFSQRIIQLEARNKKLEEETRFLTTNPDYIEKIAREKMGLIREGEKVYKIVPQKKWVKISRGGAAR